MPLTTKGGKPSAGVAPGRSRLPGRRTRAGTYVQIHREASAAPALVGWAKRGWVSGFLARVLRPQRPSVLVLSLPRSGSSWVGLMLGSAPDALYLREPVTQSDPRFYQKGTVFPLVDLELAASYQRLADRAFLALPDFAEKVVISPQQWSLAGRRKRLLVIKEVNPLACGWYLSRYRPRVIFLVRHPAATAWSAHRQGWLPLDRHEWAKNGLFQARALREARGALEGYADCQTVSYESLAADPLGGFEQLFEFAGLKWNDATRERVREYSAESAWLIDSWRADAPDHCVAALGERFRSLGLPWYADEAEW